MIVPTIGRKVWYRPSADDLAPHHMVQHAADQPFDATVVFVWSPTCVNLLVRDHTGDEFRRPSVQINLETVSEGGGYAEWMPYQIGQAKKHEAEDKPAAG